MRKLMILLICVAVVALSLGAFLIVHWMQDIPDELAQTASLIANVSDAGGVDTSSVFQFDFDGKVSAAAVFRGLKIEPEIEVGVHQGSSRSSVQVVPNEPLAAGTVYTFSLCTDESVYSWSFQTKDELHICSCQPLDRSTDVAQSSSISLLLDKLLPLDMTRISDYISIDPQVNGSWTQNGRLLKFTPAAPLPAGTVYTVTVSAGLPLQNSSVTLDGEYSFSFETKCRPWSWLLSAEDSFASGSTVFFTVTPQGKEEDEFQQQPDGSAATARLFRYNDAMEYGRVVADCLQQHPSWGNSDDELHGVATEKAVPLCEMTVELNRREDGSFLLPWPDNLDDGCYLLRLSWQGETHEALFCVSSLKAALLNGGGQDMLWIHRSGSSEEIGAAVTELITLQTAYSAEENGLVRLNSGEQAVYLIESNGDSLIVCRREQSSSDADNYANWRYLYLDQSNYQPGDELCFWGMALPRDGSALEYQRVSVYILPQGCNDTDQQVYFTYADLNSNMFQGCIELPLLTDGVYSLQIRQSGKCLVARDFGYGSVELKENQFLTAGSASGSLQLDGSSGYDSGDSFAVSYNRGEGSYLFIEEENGLGKVSVSRNNLYLGTFQPQNRLNSFVQSVFWNGRDYAFSEQRLLSLNYSQLALTIQPELVRGEDGGEVSLQYLDNNGKQQGYRIFVRDADGNAVANAFVSAIIVCGSIEAVDPLDMIYTDYQPSAVYDASGSSTDNKTTAGNHGETLFFATGHSNADGLVIFSDLCGSMAEDVDLRWCEESCCLLVQAISINGMPMAGSCSSRLSNPLSEDELAALSAEEAAAEISVETAETSGNAETAETTTESADAEKDFLTAEIEMIRTVDGGVADGSEEGEAAVGDVYLAALCALDRREDIPQNGLRHFLEQKLWCDACGREQQIAALVGLAALGRPVLVELKYLAALPDLNEDEALWLAAGLRCLADERTACACACNGGMEAVEGEKTFSIRRLLKELIDRRQNAAFAAAEDDNVFDE